jgi:hypothetical protein
MDGLVLKCILNKQTFVMGIGLNWFKIGSRALMIAVLNLFFIGGS